MITTQQALAPIPDGLRNPLIEEYSNIQQNYLEHRWMPGELSGGRFCEIVYTILQGYSTGNYPPSPTKPPRFVDACRALENTISRPRSFKILIPRICLHYMKFAATEALAMSAATWTPIT
jgi:hypothetical protein